MSKLEIAKVAALPLIRRLCLDVVIWFSAPAIFLYLYINNFAASSAAALPHLRLVFLLGLCVVLARMLISRAISDAKVAQIIAATLLSFIAAVMVSYYALALVGLQAWQRVISWELITSYAAQAPDLAKTLEISLPIATTLAAFFYLLLLVATRIYIARFDWSLLLKQNLPPLWQALLVFSLCVLSILEAVRFLDAPPTMQSEPISLTFFGDALATPSHSPDSGAHTPGASTVDPEEDAARASYKANLKADRKNIILIVVDALRADHMGLYGYGRDTTPYLNQLARTEMVQKAPIMRSTCAESSCGLSSLASSKFVHQISDNSFTLQQVLQQHGYQIHMILGGDHTHFYGLKERYGTVDSYFDGSTARGYYANDDRLVMDKVASLPAWNNVPTLFQLHLMSAHILGKRFSTSTKYLPAANYNPMKVRELGGADNLHELATNYYDNGVFQADMVIDNILQALRTKGYLDNSIVVITADHGESLGERGLYNHANGVHEAVLRIPFVMISFGYNSRPFSDKHIDASQVDIAPTLLKELDMPQPVSWAGVPLQQPETRHYTYFQEGMDYGLIDLRDSQNIWKYWINKKSGKEYAFNLSIDAQETINRIAEIAPQTGREWRLRSLSPPLVVRKSKNLKPVQR